jgi:sugar-specific transcriptional regulator TrmB
MEEIAQTFVDLGLTAIQAKVLVTINGFEYATVKEIAKAAGIYRQEVYPVLKELQSLGLVERKLGVPNEYRTMPMAQMLGILLERKTNWMSEVQKRTSELIKKTKDETELNTRTKQEEYDFTLITGVERFGQALVNWTNSARTIDEVIRFDSFSYQIGDRLKTDRLMYQENAKVRLVTCARPENVHVPENFEIRYTSFETPAEIAVYNGNRAHLAIFSNRDNVMQTEVAALTSNHPCFVKMLQNYFDVLWANSKRQEVKTRPHKKKKLPITNTP